MSGQATGWVLRHGPRDRALRLVLLTIADAANRDGECARPGMGAIIEGALYSEGHCRRAIAKLEAEGWLEETERPGPGKVAEFRLPGVTADNAAHSARRSDTNAAQTPRKRRASRRAPFGQPHLLTRDGQRSTYNARPRAPRSDCRTL